MGSKRRYKIGPNPAYDEKFDRLRLDSQILNGGNKRISVHSTIFDRGGLQATLFELKGNEKGKYFRGREWAIASIPYVEMKLEQLEKEFRNFQQSRINQGFAKPKEPLKYLMERMHEQEARLDVLTEEVEEIEAQLKTFTDKEELEEAVLQYGLLANTRLHGSRSSDHLIGTLAEIDGQTVSLNGDELYVISDERSPYCGMSVADYRELAKSWQADRQKKQVEELKELQQRAREEGNPVPNQTGASAPKKVKLETLPTWPEGVKNHLVKTE